MGEVQDRSGDVGVALVDPKFPHNVGGALRACAAFQASCLMWSGERVPDPDSWPEGARLPREERIKAYRTVGVWGGIDGTRFLDMCPIEGATPVAVEVSDRAENLVDFVHPERALYFFGPEDGGIPKAIRTICHRFVTVPTVGCLNLAATVNVVLYDRNAKIWKSLQETARRELAESWELMGR